VEVRRDRSTAPFEVEPGITAGDYLQGFLRGTRTALYDSGRGSITVSIPAVTPYLVGALIALYERAVGFYGSLVNINAYHQPGVEAGKKAAATVLQLQQKVRSALSAAAQTAPEIATKIGEDPEAVYHVLTHLAANASGVTVAPAATPSGDVFSLS
jgi:glucose-6-phosphate isomerase